MYKDLDLRFAQDDKVFDRLMTDAEPLWRRMMELTVAFAAQAKRQQSNALSVLGSGSAGGSGAGDAKKMGVPSGND